MIQKRQKLVTQHLIFLGHLTCLLMVLFFYSFAFLVLHVCSVYGNPCICFVCTCVCACFWGNGVRIFSTFETNKTAMTTDTLKLMERLIGLIQRTYSTQEGEPFRLWTLGSKLNQPLAIFLSNSQGTKPNCTTHSYTKFHRHKFNPNRSINNF